MNVAKTTQQQQKQSKDNRRLVLIHRPPTFDFPFRQRLEQRFDLFDPLDFPHQTTHTEFQTAHVLLRVFPTPISKEFLSLLASLQLIVGSSIGIDHIDLTQCWRRGIQVTSAGSAFSEDVADYPVDVMAALGKKGVIVNVGHGALIDEQELVKFLVRGELRGAGFDVFENDSDVPKELFTMDNVVLSPHVAVTNPACFAALEELIIYNLKAFFENKPLHSVANLE